MPKGIGWMLIVSVIALCASLFATSASSQDQQGWQQLTYHPRTGHAVYNGEYSPRDLHRPHYVTLRIEVRRHGSWEVFALRNKPSWRHRFRLNLFLTGKNLRRLREYDSHWPVRLMGIIEAEVEGKRRTYQVGKIILDPLPTATMGALTTGI
jgi:hypothetical protein